MEKIDNDIEPLLPINYNNNNSNYQKKNKNITLLNPGIIKKELKRQNEQINSLSSSNELDSKIRKNILILVSILIILSIFFFFKSRIISLKKNYLSDKTLFSYNIFYSAPQNNFLLFIILICCFTISSGFKLLILQILAFILSLTIIFCKNRIVGYDNIVQKNIVTFNCANIIISFLYFQEKLIQICKKNTYNIFIQIIVLFFNFIAMIYFVLVEIINCKYDDIIIDINWTLLTTLSLYFSIFYIMKYKIFPKIIISLLLRKILVTFFIILLILIIWFIILFKKSKLDYFFANKILMKMIGFIIYLIFELYFLFKNKKEKKFKYFNTYNIYSNEFLYSHTNTLKTTIRIIISVSLEHFLLYRLDLNYKYNMELYKCLLIIFMDILHGFLVLFIIKYIFIFLSLNNKDILDINNNNNPLIRYGSLSSNNIDGIPPLIFE